MTQMPLCPIVISRGVKKSHPWYKPRGGGDFPAQTLNRTKIKGEREE